MEKHNWNKIIPLFLILGLFLLNFWVWFIILAWKNDNLAEVDFFDVGQGDAIFIQTLLGHQILIDGGPDSSVLKKLEKEMPFWDKTLDLVVLTHPESDHITGLIEILKRYKVENILWTGNEKDSLQWRQWNDLVRQEGAVIYLAKTGKIARIKKDSPEIYIEVLNPFENSINDANEDSVVLRLVVGGTSFIFTGDAGKETEARLISSGLVLDSDVLKVGHHGSKNSTSSEFINAVSPDVAVISVGENRYGHPSKEVLAELDNFGIQTLITKESGDIKMLISGKNIKIYEGNRFSSI